MTAEPVVVTRATLRAWPLPEPGRSKEARGRVLVAGGASSTPGAVRLAGEAALRAGAGKLRIATVGSVTAALGVAVPEAATLSLPATEDGRLDPGAAGLIAEEAAQVDAVLVGPGLKDRAQVLALLDGVMPRLRTSTVVDALASAWLTEHPDGLRHLGGRAVLSVNPTELAHTARSSDDEVDADPVAVAGRVAERSGLVVLCGGVAKHVVAPDGSAWVVDGGGPGLGVSGSGDVLAGLVVGLLARGAEPAQAAVWAGFLHARAGEELGTRVGRLGFLARELPEVVPSLLDQAGR